MVELHNEIGDFLTVDLRTKGEGKVFLIAVPSDEKVMNTFEVV